MTGYLAPEAAAAIEEVKQRRADIWEGRRPIVAPLARLELDMVEPGCAVYAKETGDLDNVRLRHDGEARGGIVIEVTHERLELDEDVITERAFRVIDPNLLNGRGWQAGTTLLERQIDLDRLAPFDVGAVRHLWRAIIRALGDAPAKGAIPHRLLELTADLQKVAAVLSMRDAAR